MPHDSSLQEAILAVVTSKGPLTSPEIAAELEEHPLTIQRYCRQLQQDEQLTQAVGRGYVRVDSDNCFKQVASD